MDLKIHISKNFPGRADAVSSGSHFNTTFLAFTMIYFSFQWFIPVAYFLLDSNLLTASSKAHQLLYFLPQLWQIGGF